MRAYLFSQKSTEKISTGGECRTIRQKNKKKQRVWYLAQYTSSVALHCIALHCTFASLIYSPPGEAVQFRVASKLFCEAAEACSITSTREGGRQKV